MKLSDSILKQAEAGQSTVTDEQLASVISTGTFEPQEPEAEDSAENKSISSIELFGYGGNGFKVGLTEGLNVCELPNGYGKSTLCGLLQHKEPSDDIFGGDDVSLKAVDEDGNSVNVSKIQVFDDESADRFSGAGDSLIPAPESLKVYDRAILIADKIKARLDEELEQSKEGLSRLDSMPETIRIQLQQAFFGKGKEAVQETLDSLSVETRLQQLRDKTKVVPKTQEEQAQIDELSDELKVWEADVEKLKTLRAALAKAKETLVAGEAWDKKYKGQTTEEFSEEELTNIERWKKHNVTEPSCPCCFSPFSTNDTALFERWKNHTGTVPPRPEGEMIPECQLERSVANFYCTLRETYHWDHDSLDVDFDKLRAKFEYCYPRTEELKAQIKSLSAVKQGSLTPEEEEEFSRLVALSKQMRGITVDDVVAYAGAKNQIQTLSEFSKDCNTSVYTRRKNKAYEGYISDTVFQRFVVYCEAFGLDTAKFGITKTKSAKGNIHYGLRGLKLDEKIKLDSVLSRGEKQLWSLAYFLSGFITEDTKTIVLDEPMQHLDAEKQMLALEAIEALEGVQVLWLTCFAQGGGTE